METKHSRPIFHYLLSIFWLEQRELCEGKGDREGWGSSAGAQEAFEDKIGGEQWGWCIFRPWRKVVCFPPLYPGNGEHPRHGISGLMNSSFAYYVSFGSWGAIRSSNALQQMRWAQHLVHAQGRPSKSAPTTKNLVFCFGFFCYSCAYTYCKCPL